MIKSTSIWFAAVLAVSTASAGQAPTREEQIRDTPITVQKLSDGLNVLFGVGGNILVSTGPQGVLTIDAQFAGMVPKYKATIASLGGGPILYTINTHGHFDHVEGNTILAQDGTRFVGHENARELMSRNVIVNTVVEKVNQPAYPEAARPSTTFTRDMTMYFNGRRIDLLHVGPGHTSGDTAVILRASGNSPTIVHMGDVFNMAAYPLIDVDNGGDINGMIAFCQAVLAQIDQNTIIVPGHGKVSSYKDLVDYIAMLTQIRDRIAALIANGATLEQVMTAKPTAPWDAVRGNPLRLVDRAYASLKR
jgi:cyclase